MKKLLFFICLFCKAHIGICTSFQLGSVTAHQNTFTPVSDVFLGSPRQEPLFLKLNLNKGGQVYVVGVYHVYSPQKSLPRFAYDELRKLAKTSVLFVEHLPKSKEKFVAGFFKSYDETQEKNEVFLKEILKNSKVNIRKHWNQIHEKKLEDFVKDPNFSAKLTLRELFKHKRGLFILHQISDLAIKKHSKSSTNGFEDTLFEWKEWTDVKDLETYEQAVNETLKDGKIKKALFSKSVKLLNMAVGSVKEETTLESQKRNIERLSYQRFNEIKITEPSLIERNRIWQKTVGKYLKDPKNQQGSIVIVCGAEHLKGILKEGSFLKMLLDLNRFQSVQRLTQKGYVDLKNKNK